MSFGGIDITPKGILVLSHKSKLTIEEINQRGDLSLHNIKCFYHGSSISKEYADGHASLQFHVGPTRPYAFECFSRSAGSTEMNATTASRLRQFPVFVGVGNITQGFRPLDSLVRLVRLDSVYVRGRQVSQWPLTVQSRFPNFDEFILSRGNREQRSVRIGQAGVFPSEFIDNIVQGSSEIMDTVANDQRQHGRQRSLRGEDKVGLIPNIVILDGNIIRLAQGVGFDLANEVLQVFIGAFDPSTSAVKGMQATRSSKEE